MKMNYQKMLLETDLNLFTDVGVRKFVQNCLDDFPSYFWTAPASGTGKYHPEDENVEGGLVLHTRRVIRVVLLLADMYDLNWSERDILVAAAFLHDSWSKGRNSKSNNINTDPYHPLYVEEKFPLTPYGDQHIPQSVYTAIMECVASHSGKYSVSKLLNSDRKLPRILQLADYLASRRGITVDLEVLRLNQQKIPL